MPNSLQVFTSSEINLTMQILQNQIEATQPITCPRRKSHQISYPYFPPQSLSIPHNTFKTNAMFEYAVDLSTATIHPFGIVISFDDHFGLPFVKEIQVPSPWYVNLPAKFRRNVWNNHSQSSLQCTTLPHKRKENLYPTNNTLKMGNHNYYQIVSTRCNIRTSQVSRKTKYRNRS